MKVLGVCTYPIEAAATRYRLCQFVEPLARKGIDLNVQPFMDSETFKRIYKSGSKLAKAQGLMSSVLKRFGQIFESKNYDLVFVQREAMIFGPAIFEMLVRKIGKCPLILDLDDATYVSYVSPTFGKIGSLLKFPGKTDDLIKSAETVICGNRFIAEYVAAKGTKTVVVPTVVDTEKFRPVEKDNEIPILGWIGTHSTFPFLRAIFPVLEKLAEKHKFILKIIGAGIDEINVKGVAVENLEWNLAREIEDFQSFDVGLYPITTSSSANNDWLMGKSGFKAIQYLAVGVPFVVTPFGVTSEIGVGGETHFEAVSPEDWYDNLSLLIKDAALRRKMGRSGREFSLRNFTLDKQSEIIAQTLRGAVKSAGK